MPLSISTSRSEFDLSFNNVSNITESKSVEWGIGNNTTNCEFDLSDTAIALASLTIGITGNILGAASLLFRKFRPLPPIVYATIRKDIIKTEASENEMRVDVNSPSSTGNRGQNVDFHGKKTPAKPFGPFHVFSCILFIVDIFGILSTSPVWLYFYFNEETQKSWTIDSMCKFGQFSFVFTSTTTNFFIVACTIDRGLCLRYPFWYNVKAERSTSKVFFTSILFIFVFLAFSSIPLSGVITTMSNLTCMSCLQNLVEVQTKDRVFNNLLVLIVILMMMIMIVCNTYSVIKLSEKLRNKKRRAPNYITWKTLEVQKIVQKIMITSASVICWLPSMIQLLVRQDMTLMNQNITAIQLATVNFIINPWIFWLLRGSTLLRFVNGAKTCCVTRVNQDDRNCSMFISVTAEVLDVKIHPKEVIVSDGYDDPIVLRCEVVLYKNLSSKEELKIFWTKNGIPIIRKIENAEITNTSDWNFRKLDISNPYLVSNDTVFIGKLIPEKEGTYACTARILESEEIVSEERATSPVYFAKLDEFSFVSSDTEIDEGMFVALSCVSGYSIPPANLTWIKDSIGKINGVQSQNILRHDKNTGMYMTSSTIQFSNVSTNDQGEYSCIAVNNFIPSETKVSRKVFLRVKEKPSTPKIILQPESVYAVNDQPSKFVCISGGTPTPKITWFYNNVNIDTGRLDTISIDSYGHTSILAISSSTPEVTGEYKCLAKNEFGHAMSEVAELQIAAFSWIFEQEPEDTDIYVNEAATLVCRPPVSQPPATMTWYKDNKVLDFNVVPSLRQLSSGDLYFEKAKLIHAGEYFCRAANKLLDVTATSQRAQITVFAPPTVTQLPITMDVLIEHTIKLECNVTGFPFPNIHWAKNGIPLVNDERIILGLRNQTLFITSAMVTDEAFYSCFVSNRFSNISSGPTLLKVLVPPVIHTKIEDNVFVDLESAYTILCQASGLPQPEYAWTKDGIPLNISAEPRMTQIDGGLKISQVVENDYGEYNCTAHNKAGSTSSTGLIKVKVPARITFAPEDTSVTENENVNFTCFGRGLPEVTFGWKTELPSSGNLSTNDSIWRDHTVNYLDGGTMLSLRNVTRDIHLSNFTCIVKNFWSSDEASAQLTVLTKPTDLSVKVSHTFPISPGTNVTINCSAVGRPEPQIIWFYRSNIVSKKVSLDEKADSSRYSSINFGILHITSIQEMDQGYFTCEAKNQVASSSEEIFIDVLDLPNVVSHFHLQTLSSTSIKAQWLSEDFIVKKVKNYEIIYGSDLESPTNVTTLKIQATKGTNEIVLNGLKPATNYIVQISAINDAGVGARSFENTAITFAGPPTKPTSISINDVNSTAFVVHWKKPEKPNGEIIEYELKYRKISPGEYFPYEVLVIPSSNQTLQSHLVSNLMPFSTYILTLRAGTLGRNETILWGEKTSHISIETHEAPPSSSPTNIEVEVKSYSSVFMNWSLILENDRHGIIENYKIRCEDKMFEAVEEILVNGNDTSFLLSNLSSWRNYSINILGSTSAGDGPWSNTTIVTTLPSGPTAVVREFHVDAVSNASVLFAWDNLNISEQNGPGLYYTVEIHELEHIASKQVFNTSENMLIVTDLHPWTSYTAKINAQNIVNIPGPWSNEIFFKTNESVPGPVTDLQSTDITWYSISIQWRAPEYANGQLKGYIVQYHTISCAHPQFIVDVDANKCINIEQNSNTGRNSSTDKNLGYHTENMKTNTYGGIYMKQIHDNMNEFLSSMTTGKTSQYDTTTKDSMQDIIEGPLNELLLFNANEEVITCNITLLEPSTSYMITAKAMNGAGSGNPTRIKIHTMFAPTTTPLPTTNIDVTTTQVITTTNISYFATKASLPKSALIAGSSGGALFICIVIALVAATTCFRKKEIPKNNKDYTVPTSPIISKHFENSLVDETDRHRRDSIDISEMPTFIGPTEESTPKESFESRTKYSLSHYKRYRCPSPDDTETEFEYAVIQDGSKAFAETMNKKNNNLEEAVYAQFQGINPPTRHHSSLNRSTTHHPRKIANALNAKSLARGDKINWTLRSTVSCSSHDSVTSHSLKQARKAQQKQSGATRRRTASPPNRLEKSDKKFNENGSNSVSNDTIEGYYSYGQNNTNNNRKENMDIPVVGQTRHYSIEDTYM